MSRPSKTPSLQAVRHFMYQLAEIDNDEAIEKLADTRYDLVVIPAESTLKNGSYSHGKDVVNRLHQSRASSFKNKLVYTYLAVGEAENYRWYWEKSWDVPAEGECKRGNPDFLVS